jgi:hypothetical protein
MSPLTKTGKKVMASMKEQYGNKHGKEVFYASINKGIEGSQKWHEHSPIKFLRRKGSA